MQYTNIPTIEELEKELNQDNKEFWDDLEMNYDWVLAWLDIMKQNPSFFEFLRESHYEDYYLSTVNFSQIFFYIEGLLVKNDLEKISKILKNLWDFIDRGNNDVINAIYTWLLEIISKEFYDINWDYTP